ncbi:MAG: OmpA family protein [Bryobacter sp.]|nr:OmpA family protein [Bryobacter sp.]
MSKANFALFCVALVPVGLWAQERNGGKLQDLTLVKPYAGSILLDGAEAGYVELEMMAPQAQKEPTVAKGKLAWRLYAAPEGKTAIEVYRNYEAALKKAGFQTLVQCIPSDCKLYRYQSVQHWAGLAAEAAPASQLIYTSNSKPGVKPTDLLASASAQTRAGLLASKKQGSATTWVYVAIGERVALGNVALRDMTKLADWGSRAYTFIEVVEEAAVETGKVEVFGAAEIQGALAQEGKKALYGIYFDTGKAEVKPESAAQLEQVAALLRQDPNLKLYVVGHTDSVGTLEANLDLSRRRAQAVVTALVGQYKVATTRLSAQGLASLAPVASNAEEAGRALNRRVELVQR